MSNCSYIKLPSIITAIALTIAPCMTNEELALVGIALTQLGDTLTTVLAQRQLSEACESKATFINQVKNPQSGIGIPL